MIRGQGVWLFRCNGVMYSVAAGIAPLDLTAVEMLLHISARPVIPMPGRWTGTDTPRQRLWIRPGYVQHWLGCMGCILKLHKGRDTENFAAHYAVYPAETAQ